MLLELRNRVEALMRRRHLDAEVDAEVRFHLEMQIAEYVRAGMSSEEARRAALLAFGGTTQTREACREVRHTWLDSLWQDCRYAVRSVLGRPAMCLAAVCLLGVAIGITTAMFTIVDALILRPAPFSDPDQLARLWMRDEHGGPGAVAPTVLRAWRDSPAFSAAEAAVEDTALLGTEGGPVARGIARVTPGVFSLLGGVRPIRGRLFDPSEGRPGSDDRVLLSEDVWRAVYHADPSLVGRSVTIDGKPMLVVGILPSGFRFPSWDTVIWRPAAFGTPSSPDSDDWPVVYVRFAPHVPRADALRMATTSAREAHASNARRWAQPEPLAGLVPDAYYQRAVPLLSGGVVLLFFALCANVCGLFLGSLTARGREFRTLAALGAPRPRLVRQVFLESAALGCGGLVAGAALGWALVAAARGFVPEAFLMRSLNPLHIDVRALSVASLAGLAATLAAGLLPAFIGTRVETRGSLYVTERAGTETSRIRLATRVLLIAQVALSCTLLLGATLLVRSFVNLANADRGLDANHITVATVEMAPTSSRAFATQPARAMVAHSLEEQVRAVPGVTQTTWSYGLPPDEGDISFGDWMSDAPGARPVNMEVYRYSVGSDFFGLYRIQVLRGRTFQPSDAPGAVLVGERLARALWPGLDPVGRDFSFNNQQFHVVGLVKEIHYPSLNTRLDRPQFYERFDGHFGYAMLSVRCGPSSRSSSPEAESSRGTGCLDATLLRQRLAAGHPGVRVMSARTLDAAYSRELARPRATAALAFAFAVTALLAAAAGLFSVLSYSIARRRRELGIRIAFGASPAAVRRLVLRDGLLITLTGTAIGAVGGLSLARVLASLQYGATMNDPVSFAFVVAVVAVTVAVASWHPTRNAARTDPASLLREE